MIRFDHATKRYPDGTVAVDDLDLEAPSGQITVLVGPSGCGKTTSLRMINRMIEPTGGQILLDDTDTASMPAPRAAPADRLRHPARRPVPAPHDRRQRRDRALPARDRQEAGRARARWSCSSGSACPAFAKRYPAQLSGGQQQRVGVARALAADPPVMLMDEPFSAVDPVVREQLQDEFLRLQGELGKTIVFVTHDIDEAIKLGDQVAVLRVGGKLAQLASPAELLSRPVDAFVAGFVGRDRGYRALGFTEPPDLPVHEEPTVTLGEAVPQGDGRCSWSTTPPGRRAGCAARRVRRTPSPRRTPAPWRHAGHPGRQLRAALDARLSSPSGRGVVVDGDGRLLGTVTAREVLDLIEKQAERRRDPAAGRAACPSTAARAPRPCTSGATSSTTAPRCSAGSGTTPGSRCCRWSSAWCWRCRSAGWPAATPGSTRR